MAKYDQDILSAVALRGTLTVTELSEMLGVSDQTIRRIVKPLVEAGKVEKVHGAIVSVDNLMTEPFQIRMQHNREAKAQIAERIAELIPDGASVAIDAGSSAGFVAKALQVRQNLMIVTNSAFVASTLSFKGGNKVYFAGTQLRDFDGAAYDRAAFDTISQMRVNYAVLTAAQVHPDRGFLVAEQCEADMAHALAEIADQVIFAVDRSKVAAFDTQGLLSVRGLATLPLMVTNGDLGDDRQALSELAEVIEVA